MTEGIKVLIVESQEIYGIGLRTVLDNDPSIQVVHLTTDLKDAVEIFEERSFDLLIIDPANEWFSILKPKLSSLNLRILGITVEKTEKDIGRILKEGIVNGLLIKDTNAKELLDSIKTILAGGEYFDREIMSVSIRALRSTASYGQRVKLTQREEEVLDYIADGLSSKEIAERLFRAESTIEVHRKNILEKLNISNSKQLMKFAIEKGYGKERH